MRHDKLMHFTPINSQLVKQLDWSFMYVLQAMPATHCTYGVYTLTECVVIWSDLAQWGSLRPTKHGYADASIRIRTKADKIAGLFECDDELLQQ